MKQLTTLITILFISLLTSPSWGETKDDVVERNGLYYKKFSDTPFTGELFGKWHGMIIEGKLEGLWEWYYDNGQLQDKANFIDGKTHGLSESYWDNGQLTLKANFIDGKAHGLFKIYNEDGSLEQTRTFRNGVEQK